jgi:hypothetical protein
MRLQRHKDKHKKSYIQVLSLTSTFANPCPNFSYRIDMLQTDSIKYISSPYSQFLFSWPLK